MKLPELCIRQPVLAIVLNLVLMVVGIIGYQRLEIRFFPELKQPLLSIEIHYKGASPTLMENSVTHVLENALASVDGIDTINSYSSNSYSDIYIRFSLGVDFEQGINEVRDKISQVRSKLPDDIDPPSFTIGGHADPVLSIGFTDTQKSSSEIRDYVRRYITPELSQIAGVGAVNVYGASDYAMRIWLNASKMAARGVTVTDVRDALKNNNIDFPAGSIQNTTRNYSVISHARLATLAQFQKVIVYNTKGDAVPLSDVANIELGYTDLQDYPTRINGKPAIDVEVKPLKSANPITVAKLTKQVIQRLRHSLPSSMKMKVNYDQTIFLQASINETFKAMFEAIVLVIVVVLGFLGSLRAALVPIVTIPVCLVSVFGVMYLLGFTINVMTLLAMVLAIGLVVDDAIVMLENIHRYVEQGLSPWRAALKGSQEITNAIIAMTITLAAVYAPIGFAQGYTAVIFKEFAFTLAAAVIISGWTALTLSPMMCSQILRQQQTSSKFALMLDQWFVTLSNYYQYHLKALLQRRFWVIYALIILGILGSLVFYRLPQEFIPKEDSGLIVTSITSPTGSSVAYTDHYMRQIEAIYAKAPGLAAYYTMVNSESAMSHLMLAPWGKRHITTQQLVPLLAQRFKAVPGVTAYPSIPDPVSYGIGGSDVTVELVTPRNYSTLLEPAQKLLHLAQENPHLTNVDTSLKYDSQQFQLTINRQLAGNLHINVKDIADTIAVMLGGAHITDLFSDGQSYEVLVQMRKKDLANFNGIDKLYVRSSSATPAMVPLSSLVHLTPVIGQPSLRHFNRMRAVSITANLKQGYSLGDAIRYFQRVTPTVLTPAVHYTFTGKAAELIHSSGDMINIFCLALVFIYLILAAQFGSFIDPFIILLTVPLSIIGAIVTLYSVGGTLNLYTQIGLVTLVGMISKHGILITQFANNLREQGESLSVAVLAAAKTRLRPILMTTAAMVLGTIPLALATGPGSVSRSQIGWVIVGGLLIGTLFSLLVVPVAYSLLGQLKRVPPPSQHH